MSKPGPSLLDHIRLLHGIVRNEHVAREIAAAIIRGQYCSEGLSQQEPFEITEADGIWTIKGSSEKERLRSETATQPGSTYPRAITLKLRRSTGEVIDLVSEQALVTQFRMP